MARILYLGEIGEGQTSLMRLRALRRLGHDVRGVNTVEPWRHISWLQRQLQRRLRRGEVLDNINQMVLRAAREFAPDIVWADKQQFVRRQTFEAVRSFTGARLVHFTPDPYFSLDWKRTPLMDEAFDAFDALVYCKSYERSDYEATGKPVVYMPLGYCDEVHRPLEPSEQRWSSSVGFLGGWEPRRERMLDAVAEAGLNLKIWGGAWEFLHDGRWSLRRYLILRQLAGTDRFTIHRNPQLAAALQGDEVYADDYARALSGARIGLGFLRAVCEDQHTTRSFEIPACGSMLLADRTKEHQSFFAEGVEADYFSSPEELIDKAKYYAMNEHTRSRIAAAGLERCRSGRYAYIHRLSEALEALGRL